MLVVRVVVKIVAVRSVCMELLLFPGSKVVHASLAVVAKTHVLTPFLIHLFLLVATWMEHTTIQDFPLPIVNNIVVAFFFFGKIMSKPFTILDPP